MNTRSNRRGVAFVTLGVLIGLGIGSVWAGAREPGPPATTQQGSVEESESSLPPCCPVDKTDVAESDRKDIDSRREEYDTERVGLPPATQPAEGDTAVGAARASQWIEPGDREAFDLDYDMTDQDGRAMNLGDLAGVPIAMSFIFTRCPTPQMCPLITVTMANLQRDLEEAGLSEKVRLALITYDPVYDTPARLKAYGADRGLRFTNAVMLRPGVEQFRQLLHEFQIGVDYRTDGSIGHFIELLLIDHRGRYVRDYQGQVWDNAVVLNDLKRLVAEQTN